MNDEPARTGDRSEADAGRVSRRRLLGALSGAGAASLAGCATRSPDSCAETDPPPKGFEIINVDPERRTVSVEVVYELIVVSFAVLDERYELGRSGLGAGNRVRVDRVATRSGRYVVRATLEDGPAKSYLWRVRPGGCDPVLIAIRNGEIHLGHPSDVSLGVPGGPPA